MADLIYVGIWSLGGLGRVMLRWRRAYQSTAPALDGEHARLLELFNFVQAHGNLRREADLPELNRVIGELIDYAVAHFAQEERVMADLGYPDLAVHAGLHEDLRTDLFEVLRPLVAGEIPVPTFLRLTRGAFLKHFMNADYHFVKWARNHSCPPHLERRRTPRAS